MPSVSYREEFFISSALILSTDISVLIREGTHAKYHYLICGVQGDFTRSLVNDPPTHIWTRQLKVDRTPYFFLKLEVCSISIVSSSLVSQIPPRYTREAFGSAPVPVSALRYQHVFR